MRIIKRDVVWRHPVADSLYIDILRTAVSDSQDFRRFIKCVSLLCKILQAAEWLPAGSNGIRHEFQTEYVGRLRIKGRISYRAHAVGNLGYGRKRPQEM